jgi:hypothetical protein
MSQAHLRTSSGGRHSLIRAGLASTPATGIPSRRPWRVVLRGPLRLRPTRMHVSGRREACRSKEDRDGYLVCVVAVPVCPAGAPGAPVRVQVEHPRATLLARIALRPRLKAEREPRKSGAEDAGLGVGARERRAGVKALVAARRSC